MRHFASVFAVSVSVLALTASTMAETAPGYSVPKLDWGAPDLQGFWTNESMTVMNRPKEAGSLVVTPEEEEELIETNIYTLVTQDEAGPSDVSDEASDKLLADKNSNRGYNRFWFEPGHRFARVKGEIRTSWVVEPASGRIPYKPEYFTARMERYSDWRGPEARPLEERCLRGFTNGAGPVVSNGMYNNNYQIVQSPTHVMLFAEMIHDARVIPIVDGPQDADHGPEVLNKWTGDSVGWYDGDTLVVETVSVNPKQTGYISENGKVVERFTRWNDDEIFYEFTVEDPTIYTSSWKGEMALRASDKPPLEYACHEGNYALGGILAGARKLEAEGRPHPEMKGVFEGLGELGN